ncbi:MAG: M15 family metallopeptidase [Candidatus Aminicenantaceae bacterium]
MKKLIWILALFLGSLLSGADSAPVDWGSVIDILPDPRAFHEVTTIWEAYGDYIQRIEVRDGDVAFLVDKTWIFYREGRLLSEQNLHNSHRYDSLFSEYDRTGPVEKLSRGRRLPRSRDLIHAMFGRTESQVREHCVTFTFLNHEVNVNRLAAYALRQVEREIYATASSDPEVRAFIQDLSVIYSFHRKNVKGSRTLSFHAYGLALDIIPRSYSGLHANWMWSRTYKRYWYRIPLEKRWSPPPAVMNAFKRHGFIWGGDWVRFDCVHFEYRPEIAFTRSSVAAPDWMTGATSSFLIK